MFSTCVPKHHVVRAALSRSLSTHVTFASSRSLVPDTHTVAIIGTKGNLEENTKVDELIRTLPAPAPSVWRSMLSNLSPTDKGVHASTWLQSTDASSPIKLVLGVLPTPTSCMRHDCEAQPHDITSIIQESGLGGPMQDCESSHSQLFLSLDTHNHVAPAATAVARSFPTFSAKSGDIKHSELTTSFLINGTEVSEESCKQAQILGDAVRVAASIVDRPADRQNTEEFVLQARQIADTHERVSIEVIEGEALRNRGYGGLWGVGKAAHGKGRSPALVVLSLRGEDSWEEGRSTKRVCWVGKGVVYDTGGLSLKPSDAMCGMKMDCGGAGAVLAAFEAACTLDIAPDAELHCVLCLAENSIGSDALRNDDIITSYSGKTIEINNTDAEGRLILADGVAHAVKHLQPTTLIDVATLTGAQMVATGKRHAGIVCNNEDLEKKAIEAGKESGDLVHPLVYSPSFFRQEFASKVADMKNHVKDRMNASSSCAGHFVEEHMNAAHKSLNHDETAETTAETPPPQWLHVDIAGPTFANDRATGFGTALLLTLNQRLGL